MALPAIPKQGALQHPNDFLLHAAPILQLLGKILNIETVCVTMIVEGGVLVRQGTGNFTEQKFFPESGVCHWILAPDRPTTMIVEDMQLDARSATCLA